MEVIKIDLTIEDGYNRVLLAKEEEARCKCTEKEVGRLFFCEQDNIIYCRKCLMAMKHHPRESHIDYRIDMIKISNHILNKELLKDGD